MNIWSIFPFWLFNPLVNIETKRMNCSLICSNSIDSICIKVTLNMLNAPCNEFRNFSLKQSVFIRDQWTCSRSVAWYETVFHYNYKYPKLPLILPFLVWVFLVSNFQNKPVLISPLWLIHFDLDGHEANDSKLNFSLIDSWTYKIISLSKSGIHGGKPVPDRGLDRTRKFLKI